MMGKRKTPLIPKYLKSMMHEKGITDADLRRAQNESKRGRPSVPDSERKRVFSIRATDAELEAIDAMAKAEGLTRSEFIIHTVLQNRPQKMNQ